MVAAVVIAAALSVNASMNREYNSKPDSEGHVLSSLWKDYNDAVAADRPQKVASILEEIKSQARAKRLHWDFYDAASRKVDAEASRNWKLRASLQDSLAREVAEYDEPIVTYALGTRRYVSQVDFVQKNKSRLQAGRNAAFHSVLSLDDGMTDIIRNSIRDDYEFALWNEFAMFRGRDDGKAADLLAECLGSSYPGADYLEFCRMLGKASYRDRESVCRSFASSHEGRAIRLLALGRLVGHVKDSLDSHHGTSEDYSALLADCRAYEKERKSFRSGVDHEIASVIDDFSSLAAALQEKEMTVGFSIDTVVVLLRNVDQFELTVTPEVKDAKPIFRKTVNNPSRRFYAADTVKVPLPGINDGNYLVTARSGKLTTTSQYERHSISLAIRWQAGNVCAFYAADCGTGKPVEKVDLRLIRSESTVARTEGIPVDGFTVIPETITKAVKKDAYHQLVASYVDADGVFHESRPCYFGLDAHYTESGERKDSYCIVFSDKGAYNPGETARFKAVFYQGNADGMEVFPAGKNAKASLWNSEDKKVAELDLRTNEFGAVAGEFEIPVGQRNGHFGIEVECDGAVRRRVVVVDEFVLPSYDLEFEEDSSVNFPGDTVEVRGKVSSYSGHPLSSASVSYVVKCRTGLLKEGSLTLSDDGSFSLDFPAGDSYDSHVVTVKVTDATGETQEFSHGVFISGSFDLGIEVVNHAEGRCAMKHQGWRNRYEIISGDEAEVRFTCRSNSGKEIASEVSYELKDLSGNVVESSKAPSNTLKKLRLPAPGSYSLTVKASLSGQSGKEVTAAYAVDILRLDDSATVLDAPYENVFKLVGPCADGHLKTGEDIILQAGAGSGQVWMVVELFGDRQQLLEKRLVHLDGRAGEKGSLEEIHFNYSESHPDGLLLSVFYFRNGMDYRYTKTFLREKPQTPMKLSFNRLSEKALPGSRFEVSLESEAGCELVAAVFDKSSERISSNAWARAVNLERSVAFTSIFSVCGGTTDYVGFLGMKNVVVGSGAPSRKYKAATRANLSLEVMDQMAEAPMAAPAEEDRFSIDSEESADAVPDAAVRSDFSTSLAFEPFLHPDKDGKASFAFDVADKLTTFAVQVYAHDKTMRDALIRDEFVVTIPVKVTVSEPKYIHSGDRLVLHATVSNTSDIPVSGTVALRAYPSAEHEGAKPYATPSTKVTVPANGSVPVSFEVDPKNHEEIGLMVSFSDKAKTFSDAMFVTVPVLPAEQTLTEAHSAVLLSGMDRTALLRRIQSEFTGTTHSGAEYSERDIRRMVIDALPSKVEPSGRDVLSLSEALYVRKVAASLGADFEKKTSDRELFSRIMACRCADGGFGWFEGMSPSASITAVILERFSRLDRLGLGIEEFDPAPSVTYLDKVHFLHSGSPAWCGWLSDAQYMHVRSLYPEVAFDVTRETAGEKAGYRKEFKEFREFAGDYLVPSKKDGRGLNGRILEKARRIRTLINLVSSEDGIRLASAWGVKLNASSRMRSSIGADALSLIEYSVEHVDGGWYYPNAVMPWRGLLESELYAHSLLCDLLCDEYVVEAAASDPSVPSPAKIADGIRIWLMLQKETQKWGDDPAFVDAIGAVLAGPESVLDTRVVTLTKTYRKPVAKIAAAGNGFTVERRFFRETAVDGKVSSEEIKPGALLHVGDKVVAEYRIWNQENRSFVKLVAPREAAFRPVEQLSGCYGWWLSPLRVSGVWALTPQGYRNVKASATEYYFDVYPEENTTVSEAFYVTQEGVFTAPVVTVESLYAPHYRANDGFRGPVKTDFDKK